MNAASLHLITGLGIALISIGCLLAAAATLLILRNSPKKLRAIVNSVKSPGKAASRITGSEESETPPKNLIATPIDPPALKSEIEALIHLNVAASDWIEHGTHKYSL